ncbi:MAG TPA: magnesium transporter [Pirellulaceae bacterium]|nr:magnesium transporter [Pirellulaceae bacterium]
METEIGDPRRELSRLIERGDDEGLRRVLEVIPASDLALVLSRLSNDERTALLGRLPVETAADLIEYLPNVHAVSAIENLEPSSAAAIIEQLPSHLQGDLIGELDDADARNILDRMPPEDAASARQLSRYEDDEAGGLMITEMLVYDERQTVASVIADLRIHADAYRDYEIQYGYVRDEQGCLSGVLRMRDLLLAPHDRTLDRLMIRHPSSVADTTSLEELAEFFDGNNFLGVPVVDRERRPVGVVLRSAVHVARAERQGSDLLKMQGIVGGEELRSFPLLTRSRRRLAWLSVNIVLNLFAASVIAAFQDTLSSVIALAVFLPIISDMSGCSGNQAVAVTMRELSLGLVRADELLRVWLAEVSIGLMNGAALGVMIGLIAWLWQGPMMLGLVVAAALAINTVVAVSLGGILPLLMRRLNLDPAIASGPILTTVTDMCGFFWVLGLASLVLDRLT